MSFNDRQPSVGGVPTVSQLNRLAGVGWSERERRMLDGGDGAILSDEQVLAVRRRVYGDSYQLSDGMSVALPEDRVSFGERRRVVSMGLTRIALDAARWLECRDVLHLRQQTNTLARVTDVYQFLWDDARVKHARHHVEISDRFGRTGEVAPLDCVFDNLSAPDNLSALETFDLEDDFGQVSAGECDQLIEMLQGYYTELRAQSRS